MSHEFESGFFVKEPAWHRLGVVLKNAPRISEGIKLAGLDWSVTEEFIFRSNNSEYEVVPSHKLIVRDTDKTILGVVGKAYKPLQNIEAFSFFDFLLHEGDAQLDAAGSLKNGRRIWVLAKLSITPREVREGDAILPYLLLSNSHDQSICVTIIFTPIRVVCNNTLSAALSIGSAQHSFKKPTIKIKHTSKLKERLALAQRSINLATQSFDISFEHYRAMTQRSISTANLQEYLENVFQKSMNSFRDYDKIVNLIEAGQGNNGRSFWDAYNGVTEYLDHVSGRNDDSRLFNSWFGSSVPIRDRAYQLALV